MRLINGKIQFIHINTDYLRYLSTIEPELQFDEDNNYEEKPHIGILLNNQGVKYVVPLTSAKNKHATWADVSATWYRLYEIIDIRTAVLRKKDVIVEIVNQDILKTIALDDRPFMKQKIFSVLDMRKMFPVREDVYVPIEIKLNSKLNQERNNRNALMLKEYFFLLTLVKEIEEKTEKIYQKQISSGKILKYHCNYKRMEEALRGFR